MFKLLVKEIIFQNGLKITLTEGSILVVIGPNNSGKSVTLSDIAKGVSRGSPAVALRSVDLERVSTADEVVTKMLEFADADGRYNVLAHSFGPEHPRIWWEGAEGVGTFFTALLVSQLTTRARLGDCDPAPSFEARLPLSAAHPFQHMYRDPDLEAKASAVVRRAFKHDFVLHRYNHGTIPAYVGSRPKLKRGETANSKSYIERVEKLDRLEEQGDGLRSFVSVIGRVLTELRPIQLIDEPEAFLHPPQARLIGSEIARNSEGRQTVIATHSSEVLQGLLSHGSNRVAVVRLSRTPAQKATHLSNVDVAALWKDPILRFSNVLDGLFHDGVIVTEADADCRFYEALAEVAVNEDARPDVHYTYSGGKDRIPVVVRALASLKVPIASVIDFDVLNNDQPLRRIFEAHGGDWATIESDWRAVKAAVEAGGAFLSGDKFREDVIALLKSYGNGVAVPKETLREIKTLAKNASPWDRAKDSGLAGIATGGPTNAAGRVLDVLAAVGVFVVPVGQMEGFCRSLGGHGPRWVEQALKRDLATDQELESARQFIAKVVAWLEAKRKSV